MALTLEEKKAVVAEVAEVAKGALSAVAAEYCGLTVEQLTDLRVKARGDCVWSRTHWRVVPWTVPTSNA